MVVSVEILPGHKYIVGWEVGMKAVNLLENHYCVPHGVVHELNI